jgi:thiol-disulfide isomerase/thioredoxin
MNKKYYIIVAVLGLLVFVAGCKKVVPTSETPAANTNAPVTITDTVNTNSSATIDGTAIVKALEILILESFPVQVHAMVRGDLPDACTKVGDIMKSRSGNTFTVRVATTRPADALCAQVITRFEESIPLDVIGMKAGTYTVDVNGVRNTFELAVDNQIGGVSPEDPDDEVKDLPVTITYSGKLLAGSTSKVLDFNKADYDKALAANKDIVLYFYASWCPLCRAEVPELYSAFDKMNDDDIVAFRVNFNDGDTDKDEEGLAREFGVAYQHTKVFLKDGKRVLKAPDTWNEARYTNEINKSFN